MELQELVGICISYTNGNIKYSTNNINTQIKVDGFKQIFSSNGVTQYTNGEQVIVNISISNKSLTTIMETLATITNYIPSITVYSSGIQYSLFRVTNDGKVQAGKTNTTGNITTDLAIHYSI